MANHTHDIDEEVDDCDDGGVTSIFTPNELMKIGLLQAGYSRWWIRRAKKTKTNIGRFKGHYGASLLVLALVWEDLQRTEVEEAFVQLRKTG
jgi:hypothetical protein